VIVIEKEEMEKTSKSSPKEEENADKMLTPWEKELDMLEDWLSNTEPIDDFHENKVMKILGEENSTELLRNFGQGTGQMMTTTLRPAAEDEEEFNVAGGSWS
jgi:hypothetical protein